MTLQKALLLGFFQPSLTPKSNGLQQTSYTLNHRWLLSACFMCVAIKEQEQPGLAESSLYHLLWLLRPLHQRVCHAALILGKWLIVSIVRCLAWLHSMGASA